MRLHEDRDIFASLIEETAQFMNLREVYVEKDYWVTKALKNLSNSIYANKIVFKGGTSLSKAYKLIERFSEDIDLALFPIREGDSVRKKLLRGIEKTATKGLLYQKDDERESKGSKFRRTVHRYPKVVVGSEFGQASSELLIEINAFANPSPYEICQLDSLIAETLIKNEGKNFITQYELEPFPMNILSVKRTLVEKIFRLIKESYDSDPVGRLSMSIRHLYDICLLLKHDKYRFFIESYEFPLLMAKCIEDEKKDGFKLMDCMSQALDNIPLFSQFGQWKTALAVVYNEQFSHFVYGTLPTMDDIEDTVIFLSKHYG